MPQDCAPRVGDETRQWREGETFAADCRACAAPLGITLDAARYAVEACI
ncbi:aspartyl/asparaginyl beta-hydroxylase domain-containing protein [Micromonospora parva]|nr:aspartyl/asparaginyl beta-hydroxylase domain-containing protein [Micromonospora parva]